MPSPRTGSASNLTFSMFESLGCAIVARVYRQEKLPTEATLAKEYGVSRSVAREAVKMLTSKGLLSARPRQGTTVEPLLNWSLLDPDVLSWLKQRPNPAELLHNLNEVRFAIEPAAAALAARMGHGDDVQTLSDSLATMEGGIGSPTAVGAQLAFHTAILRASANPFFACLSEAVRTALVVASRNAELAEKQIADLPFYAAVRDAIANRNAVTAYQSMQALIEITG